MRSKVLDWLHTNKLFCHPGVSGMLSLAKRHFWWSTINHDIKEFIAACTTCARNKPGNQPPAGLLQRLPTPSCPLSHISVDFVTGLPPSNGNTTILTVIDKATHYIPLPKLPSALETAQLLIQYMFRIHGIRSDVVSDCGPQLISQVWCNFCNALGASTSLTSGYHPQSNSQVEQCNQVLETTLQCIVENNPSTWSQHLIWGEYVHNSHKSSEVCHFWVFPLLCTPLFPSEEADILLPFVQHHFWQCQRV